MTYPDLLLQYLEFSNLRKGYSESDTLGLNKDFVVNTTTLLPLQTMIELDRTKFLSSPSLKSSIKTVMDFDIGRIKIPTHQLAAQQVFSTVMINTDPSNYGGDNALMYMVAEMVDNVYQHSGFSNGSIALHISPSRGIGDLSILDDGITIRTRFQDAGMIFSHDSEAIASAINGLSSKPGTERGYGLQSTARLVINGLMGELFITSGSGAVYVSRDIKERYDFGPKDRLDGTLITFRVPNPCSIVDIYKFVD